jgi:hypothetical protein
MTEGRHNLYFPNDTIANSKNKTKILRWECINIIPLRHILCCEYIYSLSSIYMGLVPPLHPVVEHLSVAWEFAPFLGKLPLQVIRERFRDFKIKK